MGITKADLDAQRAMLARGEEKRKADWKKAERERLRDTFAAAALTGLLSNIPRYQLGVIAVQAYDIADAMLRERSRTGQTASDTPPQSRAGMTPESHDQSDEKRTDANTDGDIATRLRQTRADMIGTDDEQHYWDCHDAAHEIERLRLRPRPSSECPPPPLPSLKGSHDELARRGGGA